MTAQYDKHHFEGRIYVQQKPIPVEIKAKTFQKRLKDSARKKGNKPSPGWNRIMSEAILNGMELSPDLSNRILKCPVNETVFINVVNNGLDFIVWDLSSWSTSRLYEQKKQNKIKEYSLIEIYLTFKGKTHSVICEYQGFFTTQSNHEVTFNEYKQFVRANSYVLKLGKILKIN